MDEQRLLESLMELREQMTEIQGLIDLFTRGKNLKHLKTFRVLTVKLSHTMKELRADTLTYEKEMKARLS